MKKLYFDLDKKMIKKVSKLSSNKKYVFKILHIDEPGMLRSLNKLIQHGPIIVSLANYYNDFLIPTFLLVKSLKNDAKYSTDNSFLFYLDTLFNQFYNFEEYLLQIFNDYFELKLATSRKHRKKILEDIKYSRKNLPSLQDDLLTCDEEDKSIIEARIELANVSQGDVEVLTINTFKKRYEKLYVKDEIYRELEQTLENINSLKVIRNTVTHVRSMTFDGIKAETNPYLPIYSVSFNKEINNNRIYNEGSSLVNDSFVSPELKEKNIIDDVEKILNACKKALDIANTYAVSSLFPNQLQNEGRKYYIFWTRCNNCGSIFLDFQLTHKKYTVLEKLPKCHKKFCVGCLKEFEATVIRRNEINEYFYKYNLNKYFKEDFEITKLYMDSWDNLEKFEKYRRLNIKLRSSIIFEQKLSKFCSEHNLKLKMKNSEKENG
ncbi:hypothetical protein JW886_06925 [Lactococcus taiwanensis]|uniref:Uncharacterized protein n=1 Tax=Lactococcus taiwanensis TaxID=1151742 RepID=A0AA45QQW1_9LACT|nr:hypothetical protein [Lactococcus taiwanensis]QSE76197.1 hypothetical protein JW886_06925 [Lactococcus taiwanensis]